jgi:hypothetical protein
MMQKERVDLLSLKEKIRLVLKAKDKREKPLTAKSSWDQYWSTLKLFAQAKLSKTELDQVAKSLLSTPEHSKRPLRSYLLMSLVVLHNLLIKSIFSNAVSSISTIQSPTSLAPLASTPKDRKRESLRRARNRFLFSQNSIKLQSSLSPTISNSPGTLYKFI